MKQSLNGIWQLRGYFPNVPINTNEKRVSRHYATPVIDAKVPGGIHEDLFRAGLIPNPYTDNNSLACEWTENRWWFYETEVELLTCGCERKELVFEGLDYLAEVYINDECAGQHENMFTPMKIDISNIDTEKIKITVVFKGAGFELGQNGRTSETRTQKSRFGYKWDFGTRLVNIGIWQDVYIDYINGARVSEAKIITDTEDGVGIISATFWFDGRQTKPVCLKVKSPDGKDICKKEIPFENHISQIIKIDTPRLWYPNGVGNQPLYKLVLECAENTYEYNVGIRRLRYLKNPGSPKDALTYTIEINGKPIYIKGNNKVPLDHLYGNVSKEDYEWLIKALVNENVNLVRVWGGGIIETETFYDLCDKYGILVWQDFIQSSSGLDHIPSKHKDFLEKLADSATYALKVKRNHTSLALWTGGNELTDSERLPATYEDENIAMLKSIVEKEDAEHLFLPTTPSGPVYTTVFTREDNHDVHSPWEYYFESHYENYNMLKLLLHSEFGISSMPESIPAFMKKNEPDSENYNTNFHHGEYWWHSYRRDKAIYGEFERAEDYVPFSQWTQAEGLRYIIETERRMAPYASGSMVWQINEPWPNCDCTNLMDYFGNPKMAYYWVKKAFSSSEVSLKYNSISVDKTFEATVCLNGDASCDEPCSAAIYDSLGNLIYSAEYRTAELPKKTSYTPRENEGIFFVRVTHRGIEKDYFFSTSKNTPYKAAQSFKKTKLSVSESAITESSGVYTLTLNVENIGDAPAYFVHPIDKNWGYATLCDDACFTLLPGECREIKLTLKKRCGLFFEKTTALPEIEIRALNI